MRSDGKGGLRPEKERYSVPGSPKEVLGGLKAVGALGGTPELFQYFAQKLNSPVTFALDVGTNSDWRGDPVFGAGAGKWAMDLLAHAWEVGKPIMFDQGLLSPKPESNIPFFARALGARAAGMDLSNPEGYRAFMDRKSRTRDAVRESHERTEALKWATPEERAKLMREGAAKKLERAKEMKRLKAEERARQLKELGR